MDSRPAPRPDERSAVGDRRTGPIRPYEAGPRAFDGAIAQDITPSFRVAGGEPGIQGRRPCEPSHPLRSRIPDAAARLRDDSGPLANPGRPVSVSGSPVLRAEEPVLRAEEMSFARKNLSRTSRRGRKIVGPYAVASPYIFSTCSQFTRFSMNALR
jgi:hypothetical protein